MINKMILADGEVIEEEEIINLNRRRINSFEGKSSIVGDLYLCGNQLTSFIAEVGAFPNLDKLVLSENQLTSFSAEVGAFPIMIELVLDRNQLTSFISIRGAFSKLVGLYLSYNKLTSFIAEEGAFPRLKVLDLSRNKLTSFITEEGAFPRLKYLDLSENPDLEVLEGSVPNLRTLCVENTNLRFLDESLIEKIEGGIHVEPYAHSPGTKLLVTQSFHSGHPVVEEIVVHLTR